MRSRQIGSFLLALLLLALFLVPAGSVSAAADETQPLTLSAGEPYRFYRQKHTQDDTAYRVVCVVDEAWLFSHLTTPPAVRLTISDSKGKTQVKTVSAVTAFYRKLTAQGENGRTVYLPAVGAVLFGWILTDLPHGYVPSAASFANAGDEAMNEMDISYTPARWMSALPGNLPLSALSMPGTHDSGARYDVIVPGTAKCQELSIAEQLSCGVRYLDIRCTRASGRLEIYHGKFPQYLSYDEVLEQIYAFLQENPGETVLLCLKEESAASGTNDPFDVMVKRTVDQNPSFWYLGGGIPALADVRGKIVLMRRYGTSGTYGFNASSGWADNKTFTLASGGASLAVQDYYQDSDAASKWEAVTAFYRTMHPSSLRYYLNNTSGYVSSSFGIPNIPTVSDYVNPRLIEYLSGDPGFVGITATDFMTAEIAALIIRQNFLND